MAQRNRKKRRTNKQHGYGFPGMIAAAFLVVVLGLTYVWIGSRCEQLGREIRVLEARQHELSNAFRQEESRWARMRSPQGLESALRRWNLDMQWPARGQVVWLPAEEAYDDGLAQHKVRSGLTL